MSIYKGGRWWSRYEGRICELLSVGLDILWVLGGCVMNFY